MSEEPERGWKRPLLIALATAPIGVAVFAFVFIARSELAFDEASCPFREGIETREVREGVRVREDERTCQDGVEEHRWLVLREGEAPFEIARRRLDAVYYEGYSWSAHDEEGRVRVEIQNPGHDARIFRERRSDAGPRRASRDGAR